MIARGEGNSMQITAILAHHEMAPLLSERNFRLSAVMATICALP
jgi:hypothetical protein